MELQVGLLVITRIIMAFLSFGPTHSRHGTTHSINPANCLQMEFPNLTEICLSDNAFDQVVMLATILFKTSRSIDKSAPTFPGALSVKISTLLRTR